jgi:beta-mannanase
MVNFSIPLFPQSSSLAAVAYGEGHDKFVEYAKTMLAHADKIDAPDGSIYVRTGWEMGGEWFAWGAQGNNNPDLFIKAFQNFASAFHEVSDKFKIVWDVSGDRGDVSKFYPGDKYVDVMSQDFYWNPQWSSYDAGKAFDIMRDLPYGMQWLENFADQHGKQTAYTEWGVMGGQDGTEFIKKAVAWFNDPSHNVAYQNYWDSDYTYAGKMSDGSDWASGQAYRDAFGYH